MIEWQLIRGVNAFFYLHKKFISVTSYSFFQCEHFEILVEFSLRQVKIAVFNIYQDWYIKQTVSSPTEGCIPLD